MLRLFGIRPNRLLIALAGLGVIAHRDGPVAADGGEVVVEVPVPAAARAVVGDALAQPVPLHRPGRRFGVGIRPGTCLRRRASSAAWSRASRAQPRAWPCSTWTGRPAGARSVTRCPNARQAQAPKHSVPELIEAEADGWVEKGGVRDLMYAFTASTELADR